jgi:hypothetical protein
MEKQEAERKLSVSRHFKPPGTSVKEGTWGVPGLG